MKNEPWRGDPMARVQHLDKKLSNQKAAITDLLAKNQSLTAEVERLREEAREQALDHLATLGEVTTLQEETAKLRRERDELREVVEKLPKDADGLPVPPGRRVMWGICMLRGEVREVVPSNPGYCNEDISKTFIDLYSTREAALAARDRGGEG